MQRDLPYVEIDAVLWLPGWRQATDERFDAAHARIVADDRWLIDGLGRLESIPARLDRAGEIILIDMPLWMHFWLTAERQIAWATGKLKNPPAGLTDMVPTEATFRTLWDVEQEWMPEARRLVDAQEKAGKRILRIASVAELDRFANEIAR